MHAAACISNYADCFVHHVGAKLANAHKHSQSQAAQWFGRGFGVQGFIYINLDKEMQDPATNEFARARNTDLNEDLGKIDYVFSDKTGTLTSNEMQLREIAIKGVPFGNAEFKCARPQSCISLCRPACSSHCIACHVALTAAALSVQHYAKPSWKCKCAQQPAIRCCTVKPLCCQAGEQPRHGAWAGTADL